MERVRTSAAKAAEGELGGRNQRVCTSQKQSDTISDAIGSSR